MYFDRDQNLKRQREMAYRSDLKNQIEMKNSKIITRSQRPTNQKPQTFSLMKNIEIEAESRKNKQAEYYSQLRYQMEKQKQQKKRRKQQLAERQRIEQQKIRKDNQMLRLRAQQEMKKQNKKNGIKDNNNFAPITNAPLKSVKRSLVLERNSQQDLNENQSTKQNYRFQTNKQNQNKNLQSRLKTSQSNNDEGQYLPTQIYQRTTNQRPKLASVAYMPTYVNKVQNQSFNFISQKRYMDTYFQQLLGERRRFEQEASEISELNKIFFQEKSRPWKVQSRGLNELKKLQSMLDQKGQNYMAGNRSNHINNQSNFQMESLKKRSINLFQNPRTNQTGWRKLD